MKLLFASRSLEFAQKLFAAAGFDFAAALAAKDENALKAHLDAAVAKAAKADPSDEQVKELVTIELRSQLNLDAQADPLAHLATVTAFQSAACSHLGIKPAALAGKDDAAIKALFAQKTSAVAVEQLATAGITQASLPKPSPYGESPKTYAEHVAAYNKMPASTAEESEARATYYKTHIAKHAGNN